MTTMTYLRFLEGAISRENQIRYSDDVEQVNNTILNEHDTGIRLLRKKAFSNVLVVNYTRTDYALFTKSSKLTNVLENYQRSASDFEKGMKEKDFSKYPMDISDQIDLRGLSREETFMLFEYLWDNGILVIEKHGPRFKVADLDAFKKFMDTDSKDL
jgi:hypothetical protein